MAALRRPDGARQMDDDIKTASPDMERERMCLLFFSSRSEVGCGEAMEEM